MLRFDNIPHFKNVLVVGLVAISAAMACAPFLAGWSSSSMPAEYYRRNGRLMVKLRLCELHLKAVAVRRFERAHGRLPATLAECREGAIDFRRWLVWLIQQPRTFRREWELYPTPGAGNRFGLDQAYLAQAEWCGLLSDRYPGGEGPIIFPPPPLELDVYGLPVLFRPGWTPFTPSDGITSDDPVPEEVKRYLDEKGIPNPPSTAGFSLVSLTLRDRIRVQGWLDLKGVLPWFLLITFIFAICGSSVLTRHRRRKPPGHWSAKDTISAILLAAMGMVLVMSIPSRPLCYIVQRCRFRALSARQRLEILDRASRRGEIPESVASAARRYIEAVAPERDGIGP